MLPSLIGSTGSPSLLWSDHPFLVIFNRDSSLSIVSSQMSLVNLSRNCSCCDASLCWAIFIIHAAASLRFSPLSQSWLATAKASLACNLHIQYWGSSTNVYGRLPGVWDHVTLGLTKANLYSGDTGLRNNWNLPGSLSFASLSVDKDFLDSPWLAVAGWEVSPLIWAGEGP